MDSVAAELAAIVAVIYLLDCFRWVARSALLVRQWPFSSAKLEAPLRIAAQFSRTLAFGLPLPIELLLPAEGVCLRPLEAGVWVSGQDLGSFARPGKDARVVPWAELEKLQVDGLELRGPGVRHHLGSRRAVNAMKAQLASLVKARQRGERRRAATIDESLQPFFDVEEVERRLASLRRVRPFLGLATTALLLTISALLWAMLQPQWPWWWLVPPVLVAWVLCIAVTVFSVRRVLPVDVRPSVGQWLTVLVSPLALIRALDLIEGELVTDFEPVAVAMVVCAKADAERLVGDRLRALEHPLTYDDGPHLDDVALRTQLKEQLLSAARKRALSLERPPSSGRHCPRCLTEYRADIASCGSCVGVALVG